MIVEVIQSKITIKELNDKPVGSKNVYYGIHSANKKENFMK